MDTTYNPPGVKCPCVYLERTEGHCHETHRCQYEFEYEHGYPCYGTSRIVARKEEAPE